MSVPVKSLKDTKVFEPIQVGKVTLDHRIVFPPTTRFRSQDDHSPSDLNFQYYDERTKFPGSLIITEGTFPTPVTGLFPNAPGIFTSQHVANWKKINEQIHKNGSYSSLQLWSVGRVSDPVHTKKYTNRLISSSAIFHDDDAEKAAKDAGVPLEAMSEKDIHDLIYVEYAQAAKNAIAAGFDLVEIHAAHGYLFDNFLQPSSNKRTDKYGGSIENRARIVLELVDHLTSIIGADRLAIRLSPWAKFQSMKAEEEDVHPIATFGYLLGQLEQRAREGKRLAYISLIEPRVSGTSHVAVEEQVGDNAFIKTIWKGIILRAGNYTYDAPEFKTLLKDLEDDRTIVGLARYYISNPDLVQRLHDGLALTPYERDLFYNPDNWGYNTYGRYGEQKGDKETNIKKVPKDIA
jgi:NADPH2 dehydrogenase